MLAILIKIDLHLLKVELIFFSKILLSRCVDYFVKGLKTCSSCIVELYWPLGIFNNTREIRVLRLRLVFLCFSKHLSRVLKNSPGVCLYNSKMHLARFLLL